jgi:hypothetical protein
MEKHDNIVHSMMAYLYMTLTDGKKNLTSTVQDDRFITWCLPGMPIAPEDLRFAREGTIGKGADDAERARDTALLSLQAVNFARLVDFIPDVRGKQIVSFQPGNKSLSSTYEAALRFSKVADTPLTKEEEARVTKARDALYKEEEVVDADSGLKELTTVDTPKLKNYKKHQAIFEKEFLAYNSKRIKAEVAASAADVLEFERNGPILEDKVRIALRDWEAAGKRHEIETLQATIAQMTDRSLLQWKQKLVDRLTFDKKKHPTLGDYFPVTLTPASFLLPNSGWPSFTFKESETKKFADNNSTQYGGKAGFLGAFAIGGSGDKTTTSKTATEATTNFEISFDVAQIPLSMPYLDIAFLQSRAWKFAEDAIDVKALSDGGKPPKGMLIGYPTMVIFIKNVLINFKELHDEKSEYNKAVKAKAGFSIGPISAGGSHKNSSGQTKSLSTLTEEGLKVAGMQIIGFRCKLLDKSPNPHPGIKNFV